MLFTQFLEKYGVKATSVSWPEEKKKIVFDTYRKRKTNSF